MYHHCFHVKQLSNYILEVIEIRDIITSENCLIYIVFLPLNRLKVTSELTPKRKLRQLFPRTRERELVQLYIVNLEAMRSKFSVFALTRIFFFCDNFSLKFLYFIKNIFNRMIQETALVFNKRLSNN